MLKILHFADVHARDKDIDEIKKCLDFIVEKAPGSDLIICAGDVFDSSNVRLDSDAAKMIFDVFSRLAEIAPVAVIAGTPSHEGHATEVLKYICAKHNVWVSTGPEQIYLGRTLTPKLTAQPEAPRAVISMVPAPTKQYFETDSDIKGSDSDIAKSMAAMFMGFAARAEKHDCPHILVGHWNVTGSLVSETQTLTGVDIELSKEQMALSRSDLICLGHIHLRQKIEPNTFFPGSICSLSWGEMDAKGFYIHTLEDDYYPLSEFIETPSTKRIRHSFDFAVEGGFDETMTEMYSYPYEAMEQATVRVDIKTFQDEASKIDRQAIKDALLSAGADDVDINIIRVPRINIRSKKIMDLERLRDKIVERARLTDHTVKESILDKADLLQSEVPVNVLVGGA